MIKFLILISTLIFLAGCNSEEEKAVEVKTDGIFDPVTFQVVGGSNRGEFVVNTLPHTIELFVRNNSKFPITHFSLDIPIGGANIDYMPNDNGDIAYPGEGGTCQSSLNPGQSCSIVLLFYPDYEGYLNKTFTFSYRNLVDPDEVSASVNMLVGEPASLIFTNEVTNYDLGNLERTFDTVHEQELEIVNAGGLPARNLSLDMINSQASGPYQIIEHDCPVGGTLMMGSGCRILVSFQTQNYGSDAPDGDEDVLYSSMLRFDYNRAPNGDMGSLNGYFQANAVTIEGRVGRFALPEFAFNELIVGNREERNIRIDNIGYKELILHHLKFRIDESFYATCVRDDWSDDLLRCADSSSDIDDIDNRLSLPDFSFSVHDNNSCVSPLSSLGYARDPETGDLNDPDVYEVGIGNGCIFTITFHPSVEYQNDGAWQDVDILFEYDSTWLNNRVIQGGEINDEAVFTIIEAPYFAAAKLSFFNTNFPDFDGDIIEVSDSHYLVDLGRLALVSSSQFGQNIDYVLRNIGGSDAIIQSITDAAGNTLTNTNQLLSQHHRNSRYINGCTFPISPGSTDCELRSRITPVAMENSDAENAEMFDVQNDQGQFKRFFVRYRDGTTYEDDMTPREDRVLTFDVTALLVRKGYLNYISNEPSGLIQIVNGNTEEHVIVIENVGTGPIRHITFHGEFNIDLPLTDVASPFRFIETGTGQDGADFDCYPLIDGTNVTPTATAGELAASVLDPGESCSITVEMTLRSTDVVSPGQYNPTATSAVYPERGRFYSTSGDGLSWELNGGSFSATIGLWFYDGDGLEDADTDYIPDVIGYGNRERIRGGSGPGPDFRHNINTQFIRPFTIYPDRPRPVSSAVIYRPEIQLPFIPIDLWGNPVEAFVINPLFVYQSSQEAGDNLTNTSRFSQGHLEANTGLLLDPFTSYEYVLHAGSFPIDLAASVEAEEFEFAFFLRRLGPGGTAQLESANFSADGSSPIEMITNEVLPAHELALSDAGRLFRFSFTPDSAGLFSGDFIYRYPSGVIIDGTAEVREVRIKVIAEATPSGSGVAGISWAAHEVEFNPVNEDNPITVTPPEAFEFVSIDTAINALPDEDEYIEFRALRGSPVFDRKDLVIENIGARTMNDVQFFIKNNLDALEVENEGMTYSITENECNGVNLAPGSSCQVTITHLTELGAPDFITRLGVVSYYDVSDQYINQTVNLNFIADDPAVLALDLPSTVVLARFGSAIGLFNFETYDLNLGDWINWNSENHIVVDEYPHFVEIEDFEVQNITNQNASFLYEYRQFAENCDPTCPFTGAVCQDYQDDVVANYGGNAAFAELYEGAVVDGYYLFYFDRNLMIEGSRECFYGDDSEPEIDLKGFDSSTGPCMFRMTFIATENHVGRNLSEFGEEALHFHRIGYYNNQRASFGHLPINLSGFIEANQSLNTSSNFFQNVEVDNTSISFEFEGMDAENLDWGDIIGYRVFYSRMTAEVQNPFFTEEDYVDIGPASPFVYIPGLSPLNYYYIRVVARRSLNGRDYLSRDPDSSLLVVITPNDHTFYSHELASLIDRDITEETPVSFAQARNACELSTMGIFNNGSVELINKRLIEREHLELIVQHPTNTAYASHWLYSLWLGDPLVDVRDYFPEAQFQTSGSGEIDGVMMRFQKQCDSSSSCNFLRKVSTGLNMDLPPDQIWFEDEDDGMPAGARCYTPR